LLLAVFREESERVGHRPLAPGIKAKLILGSSLLATGLLMEAVEAVGRTQAVEVADTVHQVKMVARIGLVHHMGTVGAHMEPLL